MKRIIRMKNERENLLYQINLVQAFLIGLSHNKCDKDIETYIEMLSNVNDTIYKLGDFKEFFEKLRR